jgi:pimeloyl-ACP methyl ester carboxylesterase
VDTYVAPLLRPHGVHGLLTFIDAVDLQAARSAWEIVCAKPPPSLVVWGSLDRVFNPSYGRRLVSELAGAAWVPVAGAGHLLPQERPERCAEELAGFVAEIAGGSKVS